MTRNHLADETSPYLLQHADNPVHWLPWGQAAFDAAKKDNKPILLSIGYAACHWCHVMAHESFENSGIAELMNTHFINVKVDREERPDVDKIYMDALHSLGQQGGWPLTMFLDPDGRPFWGGTYFPPDDRYGRPGFPRVLTEIARIWREEPEKVEGNANAIVSALSQSTRQDAPLTTLTEGFLTEAAAVIAGHVDPVDGGLKGAPEIPPDRQPSTSSGGHTSPPAMKTAAMRSSSPSPTSARAASTTISAAVLPATPSITSG